MSFSVDLGCRLWATAEGGYREWKTQELLKDVFEAEGYVVDEFDGIPGFVASLRPDWRACDVAMISDMDALPLPGGEYRHMCGHHQQMTALVTTAREVREDDRSKAERIAFAAFPAEEYVELDGREELRWEGKIQHLSGKIEMLSRGLFDAFRAVIATHSASLPGRAVVSSVLQMNGFDELRVRFAGEAAHAGAHPHRGRNAQNAASLFLQACAFLRETFPDDEHVRIHPVLRLPPDQPVSFVPDDVSAETYVRAATPDAVDRVAKQLESAAHGCGSALGVDITVERRPGYKPLATDRRLHEIARATAERLGVQFEEEGFSAASTDVGDISQVIPAIIIGLPGTNAQFHHPAFSVVDEHLAFEFPPTFLADYLFTVLKDLDRRG